MHKVNKCNFLKLASWVSHYCLNDGNIINVGDFNSSYTAINRSSISIDDIPESW